MTLIGMSVNLFVCEVYDNWQGCVNLSVRFKGLSEARIMLIYLSVERIMTNW